MHNALSILPPKRGRPSLHSFSIRDLFLVTVIVALAVGWWVDRSRLAVEIMGFQKQKRFGDDNIWIGPPIPPKP